MGSLRIKRKTQTSRQQVIDFINDNLDIEIDEIDIDRSQRIGRFENTKKKARPIKVKITRYNVKGRALCEKRKLKATGKSINETLTTKRIG